MISVAFSLLVLKPPNCRAENEHGLQLVHCDSAAAIFIGW